jgi:hypothetical protein
LGVVVAGVALWQSVRAEPGETLHVPLEIGYQWLERAGHTAPQIGAAVVFVALAVLFARCCRSR